MGLFDLFKKKKGAELPEAAPEQGLEPVEAGAAPTAASAVQPPAGRTRLRTALNRTRAFFASALSLDATANVSDTFYDELSDGLLLADVGAELAAGITEKIKTEMAGAGRIRQSEVPAVFAEVLRSVFSEARPAAALDPGRLNIIMLVGVNGSGKTTLAAKLAARLKNDGQRVLLCAADTFRAAAVEQLKVWAERIGVEIVAGQEGADPASVVFDACQAAQAREVDVLIVDTAGRLQTKSNLMAELSKVARTVEKAVDSAHITNILVLDSTVGQNAVSQAELFNDCCTLAGLALTKLDGTAKGGAVINVVSRLKLPVLYVGVGESAGDLLEFDAGEFIAGLLPEAQAVEQG